MKAGADAAITQFFFNPDAYFHFVEQTRRLGAQVPVVPGIMPFHNYARIAQFAQRDRLCFCWRHIIGGPAAIARGHSEQSLGLCDTMVFIRRACCRYIWSGSRTADAISSVRMMP